MGLRELAAKATGALAGAGAVRSLRTGLLPLNTSHAQNLLVDAKLACVAEHTALCYKHKCATSSPTYHSCIRSKLQALATTHLFTHKLSWNRSKVFPYIYDTPSPH